MNLDDLLHWMGRHSSTAIWLAVIIIGALGRMLGNRKPEPSRAGHRVSGSPTTDANDLEERIRRNFEEMLKRRAAATSTATREPPAAAPQVAPATAQKPPARTPKSAPKNYDELAHSEPTHVDVKVVKPLPHAARTSKIGSAGVVSRKAKSVATQRPRLDVAALRRGIVLREILDPPKCMREE